MTVAVSGVIEERRCSGEAVTRFAERYPQHCQFRPDGKPIGVVPRLQQALELARLGKGREYKARAGMMQDSGSNFPIDRKIFDITLPAGKWSPEPYTIRILTDAAVSVIITVLPPEFRKDIQAKTKRREQRLIVDEIVDESQPEAEKVTLPEPIKVGISLGDALRRALRA